jgi:hypothetical protein
MTRKKLNKLRAWLDELRRSSPKASEIQRVAKVLGRKKVKRGKEPTWESDTFPDLRPLSIPDHGGRELPTGTKYSILNQLEDDFSSWEQHIIERERLAKQAPRT